ncbi:MAG: OmpA family protein [Gammaproteobacteria bacterium]|nr:OmpA family protein [Gammaproteobacteria bacterium]
MEAIGPASCNLSGTGFVPLPDPLLTGGISIDPNQPQTVVDSLSYHAGEAVFVRVTDTDQNLDPLLRETVIVILQGSPAGDSEEILLTETSVDSGVFAGYLQSATGSPVPADCVLQLSAGGQVLADYTDPADATDQSGDNASIDPSSRVFDSQLGQAVDGASITLLDDATGLPAQVFGDDGVSIFPSTVLSGGTVTDSGGTLYSFASGEYRFPVVPPGNYRIQVTPPAGFVAPSTRTIADLQLLPGAPYALGPGSFGNTITSGPEPGFEVDIPLDLLSTELFLQKTTGNGVAAIGDFVQYQLLLENTSALGNLSGVVINDQLPVGFKYQAGSLAIDGVAASDPVIGQDGRQMTIDIGVLPTGASIAIAYVVEVGAGTPIGKSVNQAQAFTNGGLMSNVANAVVNIAEDLLAGQSLLAGRAVLGSCDKNSGNDESGIGGVRIYLEDGRYVVTDENGRYHFDGLNPGTHVVQVDTVTIPPFLELIACENNTRFAGSKSAQFVELQPGSLWRADFYLRELEPVTGQVSVSLDSRLLAQKRQVDFRLTATVTDVPVKRARAMVLLPEGFRYISGTARLDGQPVSDYAQSGRMLNFPLPDGKDWQQEIRFRAAIGPDLSGELISKALINFDSPIEKNLRTPVAENRLQLSPAILDRFDYVFTPHFPVLGTRLSEQDKAELDIVVRDWQDLANLRVRTVGHTDGSKISASSQHLFTDNYALSKARAGSVADYVATKLGLSPAQVSVEGRGSDQPLVAEKTADDRRVNRRVELHVWGERTLTPEKALITQASSGILGTDTVTRSPREDFLNDQPQKQEPLTDPNALYDDPALLDSLAPGIGWVWPEDGYRPPIPSLKVAVKHDPDQTVELFVNGLQISALSSDGTRTTASKSLSLSRWRGINLVDGSNVLDAVVRDAGGNEVRRLTRRMHYAGGPERAEVRAEISVLIANGRARPVIAVQMFDRWGEPARPRTVGNFYVDQPYRSWWEVKSLKENPLVASGERKPVYTVGEDGVARIELEPTTVSGEAVLHFKFADRREQEIRVWLKPESRDWILVGLAETTLGYNDIKDNAQFADLSGVDEDFFEDGRIAFFAKGRIKGEYLLTLAYDTSKDEDEARQKLFGTIDPNRFYTLYGDNTEQGYEASSQEKLYVKLERNQFYALFGDYETGLTVTELARYNRRLNGVRSEYRGRTLAYSAFAARTEQAFVKDEIQGNGTSGLYQLSATDIVLNSEQIRLVVRDRFRSEQIISTKTLTRYLDYNIDYLAGTVFFKKPVPSRDELFNPLFIIIEYESLNASGEDTSGGGRASLRSTDGAIEIGASYIHQGDNGNEGDLAAADLRWQMGEKTELKLEVARSDGTRAGIDVDGDAYLAELSHQSSGLTGRAYFRKQESGFGLGHQLASESGTQKAGFDGRYTLNEHFDLTADVFRQKNLQSGVTRDAILTELTYRKNNRSATIGFIDASDKDTAGITQDSQQLYLGGSVDLMDRRLTLRGSTEIVLSDNDANADFPQRKTLGIDYKLRESITLFSEYETTDGADIETDMTRVGIRAKPWNQAEFSSTLNQQSSEYGPRTFATLGLTQGMQVTDKLLLDFGIDHSNTIAGASAQPLQSNFPLASGSDDDFVATWAGATYRADVWSATGRVEYRNADSGERFGILGGLYREETAGHGFSTGLHLFSDKPAAGGRTTISDLRLSWAYRPDQSRWILFDRLDLIYEEQHLSSIDQRSWKVVNNFNANWKPTLDTQFSFQYAAKFVRSNYSDTEYTGFTDLLGIDIRLDRDSQWDWGLHASALHSWQSKTVKYGLGADIGHTVAKNVWVSIGYNIIGFHDADFALARYTAQGPYIKFRIKADQDSLKEWLKEGLKRGVTGLR